ncbi:MAG: hypothetical protein Q9162_000498 [Coniocarpon cinnabarinum]
MTRTRFLQESKFKVHVPETAALRFSSEEFHHYLVENLEEVRHAADASQGSWQEHIVPGNLTNIIISWPDFTESSQQMDVDKEPSKPPERTGQPFVDALASQVARKRVPTVSDLQHNQMLTENNDVAFRSTKNPLVDLFFEMEEAASADRLLTLLDSAWEADALATLKLIWNGRSIHLGKSSRHTFYRCCGYLADKHPLTLLENLAWIVRPIIPKKAPTKEGNENQEEEFEMVDFDTTSLDQEGNTTRFDVENGVAHGYWKDLLNILALAANDALHIDIDPSVILNAHGGRKPRLKSRVWDEQAASRRRELKANYVFDHINNCFRSTTYNFYKVLHLSVARLFGAQLQHDLALLKVKKYHHLSLAAKWAPSSKGSHDKHTLIVSTIAEYMFPREEVVPDDVEADRELYLKYAREAYRIKVISPLRKALGVVERDITAQTFSNIKYDRIPSIAMHNYSSKFIEKDFTRFAAYIDSVAEGKSRISGATLLPATLVAQALQPLRHGPAPRQSVKAMVDTIKAQLQAKVADAQWKALVQRVKDSGTLSNSIAVCDVSGSMNSPTFKDGTWPLHSSIGLSLLLAEITQPPFGGHFITFSSDPVVQNVGGPADPRRLDEKVTAILHSQWRVDTDFVAVFERLILPMALEHKLKQEDMVKRVFVFSDMHFNQCGGRAWSSSYDHIKDAFHREGYKMPELVFWNLTGGRASANRWAPSLGSNAWIAPKPTTVEEEGVVFVNGYSQGQMKVFLENGQFDGPDAQKEEKMFEVSEAQEGGQVVVSVKMKEGNDAVSLLRKAIGHRSYSMLRVLD